MVSSPLICEKKTEELKDVDQLLDIRYSELDDIEMEKE